MVENKIKELVIVGGGTSGWMTAIYLNKILNLYSKEVSISLVESPDINTLGVGEATVHNIRYFFKALGIDESELMAETQATFKTGILFRNWKNKVNGNEHAYFHPFESHDYAGVSDLPTHWINHKAFEQQKFDEGLSVSTYLARSGKSPKTASCPPYEGVVPYAYHLDATLLARYLRRLACEAGVRHIVSTVKHVEVDNGNISFIETENEKLNADLFVDCTGFNGTLIGALDEENWVSYEQELPCNKAVAIQTKYKVNESPRSYTTATALTHGWAWQIDLQGRRGNGYVYDGSLLSKEKAEAELIEQLGEDTEVLKVSHLDMKIGRRNKFWIGNCVAIGISGGFIEPLESTGIYLIDTGLKFFTSHFPRQQTPQAIRDAYNSTMVNLYEDLKDFIILHYCLTDRNDSEFWIKAAESGKYSPRLTAMLELWKHKVCQSVDLMQNQGVLFSEHNYRYVLYGMDYFPNIDGAIQSNAYEHEFEGLSEQFKNDVLSAIKSTISNKIYLNRFL